METCSMGACCACGSRRNERSLICLPFRVPDLWRVEDGTGQWGCFQCGLPPEGAVAVVCDKCMLAGRDPTTFCIGAPGKGSRAGVELLVEVFQHDMKKHPGEV